MDPSRDAVQALRSNIVEVEVEVDSATPIRFSTMIEMLKTKYLGLHL